MPLSVDLEASVEQTCVELLTPWTPLTDALEALTPSLRALRIVGDQSSAPDQLRALLTSN